MSGRRSQKPWALLVLFLAINVSEAARVDPSTRAAGMLHYPEPATNDLHSNRSLYGGGSTGGGFMYPNGGGHQQQPNRIRVVLTRNISQQAGGARMQAPELSYFGAIGVGTPAKMFNVVFDTGSSETWLPYYNWFPLANNLHYSDGYSCKDSSTCRADKRKFELNYRGTKMSGETYGEQFTVYEDMSKDDAQLLVAPHLGFEQNFLAIDETDDEQFRWKPYDGVIGLAPVAQSSSGVRNLLLSMQQELQRRGLISPADQQQQQQASEVGPGSSQHLGSSQLMFGLWFNPNQNSRHGGELMLGGVDENRFVGDIYFHKLTSWFDWQVALSYVMLGGQVVSCQAGCLAQLDTGANSVVGPRPDIEAIYAELQAHHDRESDLWLVDCDKVDQYPQLTFKIDHTPLVLHPRHYVRLFRFRDQVVCHLAIKGWGQPNWLLGTSFIGAYYTVFDFAGRRVGFATPRH